MDIYVVQQGDTIESVAQKFNISVTKLVNDNNLILRNQLVVGQTLVITYPKQVYTVQEGDTLGNIAETFGVTVMQLLRNNPFLANRQYLYPGETLVISYDNNLGHSWIVGYTYPFIRDSILKMSLPSLTYLLIFNYRVSSGGELIGSDDDIPVIQTADLYDTPTTMVITGYSNIGEINVEVVRDVLISPQIQDKIIDNILAILNAKGYSGVNLAFQLINKKNEPLYLNFLTNVEKRLHPEGYSVFLTINPGLAITGNEVTFENLNYKEFSDLSDGILFLSYDWGSTDRPPMQYSIVTTSSFLEYIIAQVPLDKIRVGLPTLGYDWPLPYEEGKTKANALNFDSVLSLARDTNSVIKYDEASLSAYFEYLDINNQPHIVWFKDARSIDSSMKILQSYGIYGIGIWNIMYYFAQMWLVINTQYQIIKV